MAMVYLFINASKGFKNTVLSSLKVLPEVSWVAPVQGRYDIIACLECENMEVVKNAISKKIRRFSGVGRTTTTIVAE